MPEGVGYGPQNTASVGLNLNVIGNHAYANSGELSSNTSAVEHLSFDTSAMYLVGRVTCNGATKLADTTIGRTSIFILKFNGEVVASMKTDTSEEDQPGTIYNEIIIPPFTKVELTCTSNAATADRLTSALITGRIYK